MEGHAWVTLATNDDYALGALVLAHSLKKAQTVKKIVIMVTDTISEAMRCVLSITSNKIFLYGRE